MKTLAKNLKCLVFYFNENFVKEMDILRATSDDANVLAKLHIDSWPVAFRGLVPDAHRGSLDFEQRSKYKQRTTRSCV